MNLHLSDLTRHALFQILSRPRLVASPSLEKQRRLRREEAAYRCGVFGAVGG
ncbi:hypothetical protein [Pseudomonas sp. Marseille-QA0892]